MSQYITGTVAVVNSSATINGTGTIWTGNVSAGDLFIVRSANNVVYQVGGLVSNTQITLTAPYAGPSANGEDYVIARDFTPNHNIPTISKGDLETAAILTRAFTIIDGLL